MHIVTKEPYYLTICPDCRKSKLDKCSRRLEIA
jgi:hypothetical protein